jgi:BlaI family transcriptional regulator, penicillinase repressor
MLSLVPSLSQLSRRERQIMDVLFRVATATAAGIQSAIPDPPSYTAVRTMLRILEDKGMVTHTERFGKYVYAPTVPVQKARASAVRNLLDTFFSGSAVEAAVSLLGSSRRKLTREQIDRLTRIVEKARKKFSDG